MLKKILIALAVIIAGVLIAAAFQPDTFGVKRSIVINAKPEKIFPLIDNFHNWGAWDPWAKLDPNMKVTYDGAAKGKGAQYAWDGNGQVGSGRMEIVNETDNKDVVIALNFIKPMGAQDTAEFTLEPQGNDTTVTWAMEGHVPFIGKIFHLFMNMDKMVGGQFEKGLNDLKAAAETTTKK
ncbi:MAG TPA: SRPBCC family protein [bacterium]|nr:SRPBCC family protein [bacterium]